PGGLQCPPAGPPGEPPYRNHRAGSRRARGIKAGRSLMAQKIVPAAAAMPLAALVLAACVSQSAYNEQASQLEQAQAQVAAQQAQIAKMQSENKWVMAGDLLFPEGGYELSVAGQAALSEHVPQLRSAQNTKIVVYGFTDNVPVGPA